MKIPDTPAPSLIKWIPHPSALSRAHVLYEEWEDASYVIKLRTAAGGEYRIRFDRIREPDGEQAV